MRPCTGETMYQPKLPEELITQLYFLKIKKHEPMTVLLKEAVEQFLDEQKARLDSTKEHNKERIQENGNTHSKKLE